MDHYLDSILKGALKLNGVYGIIVVWLPPGPKTQSEVQESFSM